MDADTTQHQRTTAEIDAEIAAETRAAIDRALGEASAPRVPRHIRLPDDTAVSPGLRPRREYRRIRDRLGQPAHGRRIDVDALVRAYASLTPDEIREINDGLVRLTREGDPRTQVYAARLLYEVQRWAIDRIDPPISRSEVAVHALPVPPSVIEVRIIDGVSMRGIDNVPVRAVVGGQDNNTAGLLPTGATAVIGGGNAAG